MMDKKNGMPTMKILNQVGPADECERAYLESLVRLDYERCHRGETLEDLKRRACFSKEDKGLLRGWMALAGQRAIASRNEKRVNDFDIAA